MVIIPKPQKTELREKGFLLDYRTYIVLGEGCTGRIGRQARFLADAIEKNTGYRLHITRGKARKGDIFLQCAPGGEAYGLLIDEEGVKMTGSERSVIWAIQTFLQILEQEGADLPGIAIQDAPVFQNRGFYHDVTRGRVPKLETLKRLADKMSRYKLNQLQLYMEHTYLFRDFSEVWRDDTPLSPEEILELDAYCADRGIELVPSISTCSHLYKVMRTQSYKELCELENPDEEPHSAWSRQMHHTVNICNPAAMELVKGMLDEYRPLFRSSQFNICADEPFDLGKGKSRKYCEKYGAGRAYVDYVKEICRHVAGLGCRTMMWGDVLVDYPELLSDLPEGTVFLNWGYEADITEESTKCFAKAGVPYYNCPGVSGWARTINDNQNGYENIRRMALYAKKFGAIGLLNTDWGDYYHVSQPEFSYIGLLYGAQLSWGDEMGQAELNEAASVLEFGSADRGLVGKICRISEQCLYSWRQLCMFKENYRQRELLGEILESEFSSQEKLEKLEETLENLSKIRKELSKGMAGVSLDSRELLGDYVLAAEGCGLFNRLGNVIGLRECRREQTDSKKDWALAKELEEWLAHYKETYRKSSRESELGLFQDVIVWYCDYLRKGISVREEG
ncbi:MAG: glycoside hydrolase family 20 zincin-like fold domain-containing protein [Eubacteriales bacterium]|nr:glycoside hydrolase family 20 zincin-like fold domain-containing protein [Eubacteriales bacterium]